VSALRLVPEVAADSVTELAELTEPAESGADADVRPSPPVPRRGRRALRPDVRARVRADLRAGGVLVTLAALAGVAGAVPLPTTRVAVLVIVLLTGVVSAGRLLRHRAPSSPRVVVVGGPEELAAWTASVRDSAVDVVAEVLSVDARPDEVAEVVALSGASMLLVLPGPSVGADTVRRLTWALEHSPAAVCVLTPVAAVSPHRLRTADLHGRTVVEVRPVGASPAQVRVKGLLDRVAAVVLLVVTAPVLLALVVAVRLGSPGPGLFAQTRVGLHGAPFRMFKLRTMHADAESMRDALLDDNESDGVLFKIRRDPRVTPLGYWLRRLSLDELPQLVNVLRGEMSLVGPRPALPSEVEGYDADARRRLVVKPGITGLWQVSGRSDLLWEDAMRLDLYYADNWRLVDDLSIAARTVAAVALARGAY